MSIQKHLVLQAKFISLMVIVFIILYTFLLSTSFLYTKGFKAHVEAQDITAYYMAGQLVIHNAGQNFYNPATQNYWQEKYSRDLGKDYFLRPFFYPAALALIFVPFAVLPLSFAYFSWTFLNILILIYAYKNILQEVVSKKIYTKIFSVLLLISYSPIIFTLVAGQMSFFLALSVVMARRAYLDNQKIRTGLWLCLLLIKPQYILVPLLFFLFRKELVVLKSFLAGASLVTILSIAIVGFGGIRQYISLLTKIVGWRNAYTINSEYMYTLRGFIQLLLKTKDFHSIQIYWIAGVVVVLGLLLFIWKQKLRNKTALFDLQWSSVIIGTILISPYTSGQDLSMLPIAAMLIVFWIQKAKKFKTLYYLFILIILIGYLAPLVSDAISPLRIQLHAPYMFGALFLLAVFLYKSAKYH